MTLRSTARFLALWLLSGALEWPLIEVLRGELSPLGMGGVLACHLGAALVAFFAVPKGAGWTSRKRLWGEPLALWTLVLPGVGWLLVGLLMLEQAIEKSRRGNVGSGAVLPEEVFEEQVFSPDASQMRRLYEEAVDVLPAVDALLGEDPELKRGAIETLSRIRTPQAIARILLARKDPSDEVRFFATSALTRIKDEFENAVKAAEREALERHGVEQVQAQISLCRIVFDFALSGLMDESGKREALQSCLRWLSGLAQFHDEALRLQYQVLRTSSPMQALALLDLLMSRFPAEKSGWLKERAELLFSLSRYRDVKATMQELAGVLPARSPGEHQETPQEREWRASLLWWVADA